MDYGFYGPTIMSFPVPITLMTEPTESESIYDTWSCIDLKAVVGNRLFFFYIYIRLISIVYHLAIYCVISRCILVLGIRLTENY